MCVHAKEVQEVMTVLAEPLCFDDRRKKSHSVQKFTQRGQQRVAGNTYMNLQLAHAGINPARQQ